MNIDLWQLHLCKEACNSCYKKELIIMKIWLILLLLHVRTSFKALSISFGPFLST